MASETDIEKVRLQATRMRTGVERLVAALEDSGVIKSRERVLAKSHLTPIEAAYVYALGTLGGEYLTKTLFPTRHFKTVMDDFLKGGFFGQALYDKQIAKWSQQTFPDVQDDSNESPESTTASTENGGETKKLTLSERKIIVIYDAQTKTLSFEKANDIRDDIFAIIEDVFQKTGRVPRTITKKDVGIWEMTKTDQNFPSFGKWRITFTNGDY